MIKKSHKPERDTSRFVLHCAKQLWCWHSSVGALGFIALAFMGDLAKKTIHVLFYSQTLMALSH